MKHPKLASSESGSTLVMVLGTVGVLLAFVSIAVDYSSNVGRNAQRDRVFNTAVEIGDGCLELAFGSWRKLSGTTENPPTSAFAGIPTPSPGSFPSFPDATITNFRVQAVDPTVTLSSDNPPISALPTGSPPPKTTGAGSGTFSYFYLATVDVQLPYQSGNLTAKVRRVFEKRYTSAWNWAMLYNGDLELHPKSPLTLDGWVHTNGNAYIGNGATPPPSPTPDADGVIPNPTPYPTPPQMITLLDRLTFAGSYTLGYHGSHPNRTIETNVADAITPADLPPGSEQVYYPFGWNPSLFSTSDSGANNDGFREMIEKPVSGETNAAIEAARLYNQAAIAVEIDASNNIRVYRGANTASKTEITGTTGNTNDGAANKAIRGDGGGVPAVVANRLLKDGREANYVRVVDFDVNRFMQTFGSSTAKGWNGIIYIRDNSAGTNVSVPHPTLGGSVPTPKRGIRVINGSQVPTGGITIVSENPVYIQGDFNSGRTSTSEPPSNGGNAADPDASGYTRQPASIMGDAITLLSNSWNNSYIEAGLAARVASPTTVNAALVGGNVPTTSTDYSGGGENFVRLLEDWTGKTFTYYGAMINMYTSKQATGAWSDSAARAIYAAPTLKWHFDKTLSVDNNGNPVSVPGYVSTVAYLQQQRWYLQY